MNAMQSLFLHSLAYFEFPGTEVIRRIIHVNYETDYNLDHVVLGIFIFIAQADVNNVSIGALCSAMRHTKRNKAKMI